MKLPGTGWGNPSHNSSIAADMRCVLTWQPRPATGRVSWLQIAVIKTAAAGQPPLSPSRHEVFQSMKPTIRIVTRGSNGELRAKDYEKHETVLKMHTQIGVDDCSTDLSLRGMPVFRGLIGPMPEGKDVVRYETPEVFETLTKEWTVAATSRSRRRRSTATESPTT